MTSSLKSRFDFVERRTLFVTSDRAIVYHWSKNKFSSGYTFALTEEGLARFDEYLQGNSEDPLYILLDLPDEEFKFDAIPHVGAGDREALVKRKRTRLFRNTKYGYYEVQGREQEGRRDDRVLFAAITEDESIQPWLTRLLEKKVPIAGIYSVALLTKHLVGVSGHEGGPALFVSLQRNAGLRQTFFLGKDFKFSRLVRMPRYGTEAYAPIIKDEVEKMLRYLRSMRYLTADSLTRVYVITDNTLLGELKTERKDRAGIEFVFLAQDTLAEKIGLSFDFVDPFSEALFSYLLLKEKPRNIYAAEEETRYYQLRGIRNVMLGSSIFILLASLVWGGLSFMEAVTLKQQSLSAVSKSKFYRERYNLAKERLPELPVEPRELETAVNIADRLKDFRAMPLPLVQAFSSVLDEFPEMQVQSMEWVAALDPQASVRARDERNTDGAAEEENENILYYQIAEVQGYISPFDGNYRRAITRINQMIEVLRSAKNVHSAKILSLPLDVSPESRLRGAADTVAGEAEFTVRIVLGIIDEA